MIFIHVAVGPYQKWLFRFKETVEVGFPHCLGQQCREERRSCNLFSEMRRVHCLLTLRPQRQFIIYHNDTQWSVGCTFQSFLHKVTEITLTDILNFLTVNKANLFMTTLVSRVSNAACLHCLQRIGLPCSQMLLTVTEDDWHMSDVSHRFPRSVFQS